MLFDPVEVFSISTMFEIQKMVKNRKKEKIKFSDIRKKFKYHKKRHLKEYCDRLIKGEKEEKIKKVLYSED